MDKTNSALLFLTRTYSVPFFLYANLHKFTIPIKGILKSLNLEDTRVQCNPLIVTTVVLGRDLYFNIIDRRQDKGEINEKYFLFALLKDNSNIFSLTAQSNMYFKYL